VRKPEKLVEEVGQLINNYGIKEVFDDTGTFPVGDWLKKFCNQIIEKKYHKEINFSGNMRFGALTIDDYRLMKKAGFRMLLFGLESGNQSTLDKLDKNLTTNQIVESCKKAAQAGLQPHLTIMFGYPWESKENALKTLELGQYLLKKGFAQTAQATIIIPYPGTPLFAEAKKNGWLKSLDWESYDMRSPVMTSSLNEDDMKEMVQGIYGVAFNSEFIIRKIIGIRSISDIKFAAKAAKKVLGHLTDFSSKKKNNGE
tara:strand:- start:71 stop:838 length:768 start_codon:yes stop_codon:yes gene_type:complete